MLNIQEQVDRVRNRIAFFLVGAFVGAIGVFSFVGMPKDNKDILTYMVGQLSGMATMALGFYFTKGAGQDAADAEKTANTGKLAEAITATAKVAVPDAAAKAADEVADAAADTADRIKGGS